MGYSSEFVIEVDEDLLCVFCSGLPENPRYCTDCEGYFCQECIETYQQARKTVGCSQCAEENTIQEAPQEYLDLLGALQVRCENEGCDAIMTFNYLEQHLNQDCEWTLVPCNIEQCNQEFPKKLLQEHILEHGLYKVTCEKCGTEFIKKEAGIHDCIQSLVKENQMMKVQLKEMMDEKIKTEKEERQAFEQSQTQENQMLKDQLKEMMNLLNFQMKQTLIPQDIRFSMTDKGPRVSIQQNGKVATKINSSGFDQAIIDQQLAPNKIYTFKF